MVSHGGTGFGGVVGCDGLVSLVVALDLLDCWGVFCIFGFFSTYRYGFCM